MKAAFLETSAKENQNVEDIFRRVIAQMENIEGGGGGGEEKKCIVMWFQILSSGKIVFPDTIFLETSSKDGRNILDSLVQLAR